MADKVGRNDPCPCGSGKKYKKCHMETYEAAAPFVRQAKASAFLCDSCRYNHPSDCTQPQRPNAKACDEYVPKA
jgi:hypothetical protein